MYTVSKDIPCIKLPDVSASVGEREREEWGMKPLYFDATDSIESLLNPLD